MDLKESLEKCRDMYRIIEKGNCSILLTAHETKMKAYKKMLGPWRRLLIFLKMKKFEMPMFLCFCCEYARTAAKTGRSGVESRTCLKCPLGNLWGFQRAACERNPQSTYFLFKYPLHSSERKAAARQIADFCENELRRLF